MSILEKLDRQGICYAVCSCAVFAVKISGQIGRDWFIIASQKDRDKLKQLNFKPSKSRKLYIMEYSLEFDDLDDFKELYRAGEFKKVLANEDGSIYELKRKSFKKYHNGNMGS